MGKYILYSLDVGQGMCTLATYYDSKNVLKAIALFDIGSSKSKSKIKDPLLEFLKEKIIERDPPDGFLDAMFISHKDADHVNLIQELLDEVPDAEIGLVRYGGRYSWYKKSNGNILDQLGKRVSDKKGKPKGFPIGDSNYNASNNQFENPIWQGDGGNLSAYLLCVNTPYGDEEPGALESEISSTPDGDQANSKSLIVLLWMDEIQAVIAGDATYPSFECINGYFKSYFGNNIMTLLPHHASRKTTFGLPKSDDEISKEAKKEVQTFAKRMLGKTVVASADTKHGHPSLETVELFLESTDKTKTWWTDPNIGSGFHYVTANVDLDIDIPPNDDDDNSYVVGYGYTTYLTPKNVYSTLYFARPDDPQFSFPPYKPLKTDRKKRRKVDPPPEGMNWVYASNGKLSGTTLTGEDSKRLDSLTKMLLEADLSAELPPAALLQPAPAAVTVSIRTPTSGGPRPAVTPPRQQSAFSRLERVP